MRNSTCYKDVPKTFRRSSTKILSKWGGNLQNIEKSLRAIYMPDGFTSELSNKCNYWLQTGDATIFTEEELSKLRVFLQVDQSGAEALVVAYCCTAGDYRALFINGVKPHVYVALKLFKDKWKSKAKEKGLGDIDIDEIDRTPIAQLKNNPYWKELDKLIKDSDNWDITERYYYLGKQTVHSSNYGIEASMFRMNILVRSGGKIVISQDDAGSFLQIYRGLFPEIPEWNRNIRTVVERTKMLYNLHGFPYTITNYNVTEQTYKELVAWIPQSTVGEITRIAFCNMQEYIESESKKWDILADTHDSYLVQCPLLEVKDCGAIMQKFMNQELVSPVDGVKFRMKSECQVGFNWAPQKEKINDLGLRELKW